jgi:hypothetical protein
LEKALGSFDATQGAAKAGKEVHSVLSHLAHCDTAIAFQGLVPVQLESAMDFKHQPDRDGGILLPPFADACSQPSHKCGLEIAVVRALSRVHSLLLRPKNHRARSGSQS